MSREPHGDRTAQTARTRGGAAPATRGHARPGPGGAGSSRDLAVLGALALVVLALRLAAALSFGTGPLLLHPVLEDADTQARAVEVAGGALLDTHLPRGSVLYPALVSWIPGVAAGETRSLGVVQSVVEAVTALLLMLWLRRRWGMPAALAAGLLYALDPMGAFFAARFSPVSWATLALVGALWMIDREGERAERSEPARELALGAVAALGFLLQPLPFLLLLVMRAWDLLRHSPRPRTRAVWLRAALPFLPLLVLSAAVIAQHASLEDGGPVLGWGGGPALVQAYSPVSGGSPRNLTPPSWVTTGGLQAQAWEARGSEGTPYDMFRHFASLGFRRITENPLATVGVLLTKAAATIGAWPVPDALSASFIAARQARAFGYLAFSFAFLLALAGAGFLVRRPDPTRRALLLGIIAVAAASLLGMASGAARQPALPLLAALGGAAVAALWTGGFRALPPRAPLVAAGLAVLSVAAGFLAPTARLRNPSEDLRLLAGTFARGQNAGLSEGILEEAVQADPKNLEARLALASVYQKEGLMSAAIEQVEKAHQADSTHAGALFTLAQMEQARGNLDSAVTLMSRLVGQRPNNPLYLNELAQMLVVRGNIGEAYPYLARAVRLKPDYMVAQQNLQMVESYRQRLEESLLPPQMRLSDKDPLQLEIGTVGQALDAEEWARADSLITDLETRRPDLVQPSWLRAAYLTRRGDRGEAIRALEKCDRMAPGRPMIVQQLAALYYQEGRKDRIEPLIRNASAAAAGDSVRVKAFQIMEQQIRGGAAPPAPAPGGAPASPASTGPPIIPPRKAGS